MRSLYGKFVLVTIGIMITSSILSFLLANAFYQNQLKPKNDQKNTEIASQIATFIHDNPQIDVHDYLHNLSTIGYQFYLVHESGKESFFGSPLRGGSLPSSVQQDVINGTEYHGMLHFDHGTFVTGFFANELSNTVGVPFTHDGERFALFLRPDIKLLFNEMRILLSLLLSIAILLGVLMVIFSAKFLVDPITKLTKATGYLSRGDFQVELDISRRDELGELAQSFSRMTEKLAHIEATRKEFISNISHDIQSPLANIKGYVNLLENDLTSVEEKGQYVDIINTEIERLSTLTKQLLLLSSFDQDEPIVNKQFFDLSEHLRSLIRNYQWIISEQGIMLSYSFPETEIYGDPSLLYTVWDNLLTNAIKYNRPNGQIDIYIQLSENKVSVIFEDSGIGLTPAEMKRVYEPFYRADSSRTRTTEGTGLGLSIVDTILKLHGGHIHIQSQEKEGSQFTVDLPLDQKEEL